jgi:hypothetical protein
LDTKVSPGAKPLKSMALPSAGPFSQLINDLSFSSRRNGPQTNQRFLTGFQLKKVARKACWRMPGRRWRSQQWRGRLRGLASIRRLFGEYSQNILDFS